MRSRQERLAEALALAEDVDRYRFCAPDADPVEQHAVTLGFRRLSKKLLWAASRLEDDELQLATQGIDTDIRDLVEQAFDLHDALIPVVELVREVASREREKVAREDGNEITEVTRRGIFDGVVAQGIDWAGRRSHADFLAMLFDVDRLMSDDHRFKTAREDIDQHTLLNYDWSLDWVADDPRFGLLWCPDEVFLEFLCQSLHPTTRTGPGEARTLFDLYNGFLAADGWELHPAGEISGRPVFSARPLMLRPPTTAPLTQALDGLDPGDIGTISTRLFVACDTDPDQAIGQAKNLVEAVCKTILEQQSGSAPGDLSVGELVKRTRERLTLLPEQVHEHARGAKHLKSLLGQLGGVAQSLADLRNLYGDGHGKPASRRGLQPRHARLAAYAAVGLATFLFEAHLHRTSKDAPPE